MEGGENDQTRVILFFLSFFPLPLFLHHQKSPYKTIQEKNQTALRSIELGGRGYQNAAVGKHQWAGTEKKKKKEWVDKRTRTPPTDIREQN